MSPQKGIMSLTKPKQRVSARDSRAVDQILDNTTQMLGKLDKKTLGLLLQLTQYIKANKPKYKELMANLEAKGSLPPGVFPDEYDPKFLSVFALSVAKAQQAKNGMAAGGIAGIAQTMKDQGRGKDTMLAHISPEEAELLEKRGGVGTINPVTGLPEYGIFDDIGNALSGVGNAVGSVLKPVGDLIGGVLSSPLGLAATAAAAYYFMGPGAGAVVPSVAGSALPGALATEAAATALTPAAIEAGIGSAGYGYNASAAASGLFDPSVIGSGAAIGAPSTSEKLLASNLLKNVSSSSDEEEQSDPNALIKMLMMYEMMGSKQQQPSNVVVPALSETTSTLPYDTPKKPTYQQTRAAGGGLMTKNLGIGGLSANRTQTDYAKNYLPGSGYRPGQGGVTYFTPMNYGAGPVAPVEPTPTPTPVDELVEQITGRPGGGRGDREPEDPNSFSAQWAAMSDAEKEAWRLENPMAAAAQDLAMLIGSPFMFAYQKLQEMMGPDSSTGGPARYTGPPETFNFGAPTYGGYPEGVTPNPYDMGPGTQAFTDARLAAAENARIAAENNARIDALIASLPDAQQVTPEDMGAVRDEKGEIDPRQGYRTALNPFPTPSGSIIGEHEARNVGTYTPGQFQGAYLPEKPTLYSNTLAETFPGAFGSYSPSEDAGIAALNAAYANYSPSELAGVSMTAPEAAPAPDVDSYAANTAAMTADTRDRINALMAAERAADAAAETAAADAAMATQDAREREQSDRLQALDSFDNISLGASTMPTGTDLVGTSSSPLGTGVSTPNGPDLTGGENNSGYTGGNFGYSGSDNNDSVGRGDFGGNFGGDFGYSGSDNNDSVGRSDNDGGGGGGGGGGGRVICTHFYSKGEMSRDMWRADLEFTFKHLSPTTIRGYQYWGIPYVKLMRKSKLAENIMRPIALHRAKELSYQMGKTPKGSLLGKVVRLVLEPICFGIGLFVGEQNWQSLWKPAKD